MKKIFVTSILSVVFWFQANSQSCTGINAGTPSTTQACYNFSSVTPGSGSSICAGSGHGGAGSERIIQFCTNASSSCIEFNFSGLSSTDGTSYALYTGCSGGVVSGYVANSAACDGSSSTSVFTTAGLNLAPNTCYYLKVWTKNAPSASSQVCIKTNPVPNNYCPTNSQISTTPQAFTNYCMTAGSNGSYTEPAPGQFCAGSLENNAWYSFITTTTCASPCTVTISITGITCSGGGSGFQIGFWTGTCTALSYIGCTSGSGGSVVASITNLTPGQTVIMGVDGNAGANCSYSISATNTQPLPIKMVAFDVFKRNNTVELKWSTATEKNNSYFTLERSTNAIDFYSIGTIGGANNSNSLTNYSFIDKNPNLGVAYYRVKQTDYDGSYTYSQSRAIDFTKKAEPSLEIIPNPSDNDNTTVLNLINMSEETTEISVCDLTGKLVFTANGFYGSSVVLPQLEKGIYLVKVANPEIQVTRKLIVK